jgi:hypothetical protein
MSCRLCKARPHFDGDATGGGHRFGAGKGKSEFPQTWSDDEIIDAIEDVANDLASSHSPTARGYIKVTGNRNGVAIIVIVDPAAGVVITGYPRRALGPDGVSDA